jgi:prepilin-type N-terminal cleavage/methylation domain-containing protein/prepilin-type processing-associated H-X9-DG protein
MTLTQRRSSSSGFTLVELLVVLSIMALLISILLPALQGARVKAGTAVCGSRIYGLGLALAEYTTEFDGRVPPNGIIFPKAGPGTWPSGLVDPNSQPDMQKWDLPYGALWPYTKGNRAAYICLDDVKEGLARAIAGQLLRGSDGTFGVFGTGTPPPNGKGYWSYSVNTVLNSQGRFRENFSTRGLPSMSAPQPWTDPVRPGDNNCVHQPSNFICFIEESSSTKTSEASRFNDEVFDPIGYNEGDRLTLRHNNGGNVGFADRHVEWFNATLFNNPPPAILAGQISNWNAMQSPYNRMFFPDYGEFANPSN